MAKASKPKRKAKAGRKPEVLVIREDAQTAFTRLLKAPPVKRKPSA